ncbi:MAG TPA: phospholipase, partial [Caulobacteraceae bacterium]|nr:phospholipase [Caulobacteraceae bacterium]
MALLQTGRTCWRVDEASRVAFLIDYQDYYAALVAALEKARRQVLVLGWSFDPRTRTRPDGRPDGAAPDAIGRLLIGLTERRPDLDVRVLIWRSALAISATQDFFPHRAKGWFKGTAVEFRLDATVPFGACHHQKLVVIDDVLAFCGSGDIAPDRWDSRAHADGDARRRGPGLGLHAPRHEVTVAVEGPAAAALGVLARERWRRSGAPPIAPPRAAGAGVWP